jgi:methyltransferase (TIGR00027 family)
VYSFRSFALVAIVILLGLTNARAIEPEKPSKTAIWVLAGRALGTHDPDPSVRNPDWLAEHFLGPDERAQIPDHPVILALDQDYREAMKGPEVGPFVRLQTVRTKFIDEHLLKAVSGGATQVVNLGAGFDSRAYRFRQALSKTRVFEVDYGPTQEYKRRRAATIIGPPPANLIYVPIDFTREKLADVLRKAGYRRDRRTFFIWEGVTMYIPREAVLDTLRYIAQNSPAGSAVAFDYYTQSLFDELPKVQPIWLSQFALMKEWGEPWIFGVPDGTDREFVKSAGLDLTETISPSAPETAKRYLTRKNGTLMGDAAPFGQPPLGPGRYTYIFAVAIVPSPKG